MPRLLAIVALSLLLAAVACTGASEEPQPTPSVEPTEVSSSPSATRTPTPTASPAAVATTSLTSTPVASPTAPPTPTPVPEFPLSGPVDDGLVSRPLPLDQVPAENTGVVFLGVDATEAELWTAADGDIYAFRTDNQHRWLVAWLWTYRDDAFDQRWTFTDRATGLSYRVNWDPVGDPTPGGLALFETEGALAVVDLVADPTGLLADVELPDETHFVSGYPAGDRRFVVRLDGVPFLLDGDSGSLSPLGESASEPLPPTIPKGAFVRTSWEDGDDGDRRWLHLERFDPAGHLLLEHTIDAGGTLGGGYSGYSTISPDGRWIAWQGQLAGGVPYGLGMPLLWATVTFANVEDGTIHFRAVQASRTRYESNTLGWLADSSGLLVATTDGYAVVRVDGTVEELPFALDPPPVASLHDPDRLIYGGQLVDLHGNAYSPPVAIAERWADGITSYRSQHLNAAGDELRFVRTEFLAGDSGSGAVGQLGPGIRIELAPFEDDIRLRYVGDQPLPLSPRSGTTTKLQPGEAVTHVAGPSDFCYGSDRCLIEPDRSLDFGEAWLIHIRLEDGTEAWVRSEQFDWAD
jgi:hypothetical protein